MDVDKVTELQSCIRGYLAREKYSAKLLKQIQCQYGSCNDLEPTNAVEKFLAKNIDFLRIAQLFTRIAVFPKHQGELAMLCRHMTASLYTPDREKNFVSILLSKNMLPVGSKIVTDFTRHMCQCLEKLKINYLHDIKCCQTLVHWAFSFSSCVSWSMVRDNAPIQKVLNSLCIKMAAPLGEPENFRIITDTLFRAVNSIRPFLNSHTLCALFHLILLHVKDLEPCSKQMVTFIENTLAAPGVFARMPQDTLNNFINSGVLPKVMQTFKERPDIIDNFDAIKALNLVGNLCQWADMDKNVLNDYLLLWVTIIKTLMSICSSAAVTKNDKCARTHWHPVFGGYKLGLDSGSEASLMKVVEQLRLLWGKRVTSCLFEKALPPYEPTEEQNKKHKKDNIDMAHSVQKLWKKIGRGNSDSLHAASIADCSPIKQPLTFTALVCGLYLYALRTFGNLRSDILSGLCRDDSLLSQLWRYVQQWSGFTGDAALNNILSLVKADPSTPHLAPLHLFSEAAVLTISILDEEEMYERNMPFTLTQLAEIAKFTNIFCLRAVWLSVIQVDSPPPIFDAVHLLNCLLYARDCRRSFTSEHKFWIAPDIKSSTLITEFERKTERGLFLMRQMSQLVSLKDRMVLFRRIVLHDKSTRAQPATLITICRNRIVEDGYRQLSRLSPEALRHTIRVKFVNAQGLDEAGIDQDGVFKEFLELTLKQVFDPALNLFKNSSSNHLYPSSTSSINEEHLQLFNFVGRVLAKAVYEGIVVDVQLAPVLLATVLGSGNLSSFDELANLDPELYKNLTYVKRYAEHSDVTDLSLTFSIDEDFLGKINTVDLIPGGRALPVTNENRISYIHKMAKYRVYTQTRQQQRAFVEGFKSVLSPEWLFLFAPHELQYLISGENCDIDLVDLRKHVQYFGGYHSKHRLIKWLWEILEEDFTIEERRLFLKFVTSCSRGPLLGFAYLEPPFSIRCVEVADEQDSGDTLVSVVRGFLALKRKDAPSRLPTASTCFNLLKIPNYSKKSVLLQKLRYAIHSETGFELS